MMPRLLDDDLGFPQSVEYLPIEEFDPEPRIETLYVTVLPQATWFDVSSLSTDSSNPVSGASSSVEVMLALRERYSPLCF
jgi:hypothetical protein